MYKFLFFLLAFSSAFTYYLDLNNDSPYNLKCSVYSANGHLIGETFVNMHQKKRITLTQDLTTSQSLYQSSGSITPFTVIWNCDYEGIYSIIDAISPGVEVKAGEGRGNKFCSKPPEEHQETPPTPPVCPPCPACPDSKK